MNNCVHASDFEFLTSEMVGKLKGNLSQIEKLKFYLLPKAEIGQNNETKIQSDTNEMGDLKQNLRKYVDSNFSELRKTITQQVESDFLKQSSLR